MSMYNVTATSFTVSDALNQRALAAIRRTWSAIGSDVIELFEDYPSREDALEMILDANRMEAYGNDDEAAAYCIFIKHYHPQVFEEIISVLNF